VGIVGIAGIGVLLLLLQRASALQYALDGNIMLDNDGNDDPPTFSDSI
jgi:hypothetical protein